MNSHINIIFAAYILSAMFQVNFKDIVAVISLVLLIIKAVRYKDIAFLFIVGNFISRSSFKSNCLAKFTASVFTLQVSLSRIVDVDDFGFLGISSVDNCSIYTWISWNEAIWTYRYNTINLWCISFVLRNNNLSSFSWVVIVIRIWD